VNLGSAVFKCHTVHTSTLSNWSKIQGKHILWLRLTSAKHRYGHLVTPARRFGRSVAK